jgi:hypothetical protein
MDDINGKIIDINSKMQDIGDNFFNNLKYENSTESKTFISDSIRSDIGSLQENESALTSEIITLTNTTQKLNDTLESIKNNTPQFIKTDETAKIFKNNFKYLYNKQYTKNATLIVGILLITGCIIKMSFYETIDYPRVL